MSTMDLWELSNAKSEGKILFPASWVLMKDVKNLEAKSLKSWRTHLFLEASPQVQVLKSTLVLSLLVLQRKQQLESIMIG